MCRNCSRIQFIESHSYTRECNLFNKFNLDKVGDYKPIPQIPQALSVG